MPLWREYFQFYTILLFTCAVHRVYTEKYYPILLWHSAGETCCDTEGTTYVNFITKEMGNDVHVRSVKMGNTTEDDFTNSLVMHPFQQIEIVCNKLKTNEAYKNGYNGIGLSQGALFLRGLAETCPYPPMKNLISLGGPHQGVYQYPRCSQHIGEAQCKLLKLKINLLAYHRVFQRSISPLTYWHDDINEFRYKRGSSFLAIINNENYYNPDYVKNLQSLKRLVLVKYINDISVIPNESTQFGFRDGYGRVIRMEDTELYQKDRIGLKKMKEDGKLMMLDAPMAHLDLNEKWFRENLMSILKEV
ncbi:palmitoyl-protein thioesterase 1-like [Chironomus tepperi]|uniref:palmitoyl-protein thioesterase 1-like n=1 Tax=Chironomus tepperi TaxID=113505 RepID=UPI00391F980C